MKAGVLIGGRSDRMGFPKQLMVRTAQPSGKVKGVREPLLRHSVEVLARHAEEVILLGPEPIPDGISSLRRLDDVAGLRGPLAGMLAGMLAFPDHSWLIFACDMPNIVDEAVSWLLSARTEATIATIPYLPNKDSYEPLFAHYEARSVKSLQRLVAQSRLKLVALVDSPDTGTPTPPEHLFSAWENINTPPELRAHGGVALPPK